MFETYSFSSLFFYYLGVFNKLLIILSNCSLQDLCIFIDLQKLKIFEIQCTFLIFSVRTICPVILGWITYRGDWQRLSSDCAHPMTIIIQYWRLPRLFLSGTLAQYSIFSVFKNAVFHYSIQISDIHSQANRYIIRICIYYRLYSTYI